jgi:large subunit ribosomal protein L10
MPKSRDQKKELLDQLSDKVKKSKSIVFVDYKGTKVKEIEDMRKESKKQNAEYVVAKKTLIKIAFDNGKIEGINPKDVDGNIALLLSYEDEVSAAKLANQFSKDSKTLNMVGGVMEGKYIDAQMVKRLANIPSRLELYAKLVGTLNGPISGFVNVLQGNLRNFVGVLDAIKKTK